MGSTFPSPIGPVESSIYHDVFAGAFQWRRPCGCRRHSQSIALAVSAKWLKLMQDADAIVAYSREQIAAYGLDVEEVHDAVVKYLLGDQILPIKPAPHPKP